MKFGAHAVCCPGSRLAMACRRAELEILLSESTGPKKSGSTL
ncbi:MAG: hypothetical protein WC124_13735 [Desulfoplanes sp.]